MELEITKSNKLKVFTAFSGYDSQCMALKNAEIPFTLVGTSEVNKHAIIANDAVQGINKDIPNLSLEEKENWLIDRNIGFDSKKNKSIIKKNEIEPLFESCIRLNNYGDISKININDLIDFDFFTYSFPCTNISVSGKGKGLEKGSGTSSSLLWECKRIIEAKRPKYLLLENVKNLVGKKFKPYFDEWCNQLEELGYTNYWEVMNAKDFGTPHNRERIFMVSILDNDKDFIFPTKEPLITKLKDILEDKVDEKHFLSDEACEVFVNSIQNQYTGNKLAVAVAQRGRNPTNPTSRVSGLPTVQMLESQGNEFSNCLTTVQKDSLVGINKDNKFRIRKLTTLEYFRLMGVSDTDFLKIKNKLNKVFYKGKDKSNSQLIKLGGNSIVVNCMVKIFKKLFK